MTFLEKFRADYPDLEESDAIRGFCPEDLGYEKSETRCMGWDNYKCAACWNREMPQTDDGEEGKT